MNSTTPEKPPAEDPTTLDEHQRKLIAGAVAELDPQQMAITRRLTPAQRFQQALSMIEFVEGVAAYRLRQRQPELSEVEALRAIRSRHVTS